MTTPSNSRLLGSSNWTKGSSDYSPTSTSTPFATPATRATSIAPSTFSRSGAGNRRAKQLLLSSASSIDGSRHAGDIQASPTPIGSRSSTPANGGASNENASKQRNCHAQPSLTTPNASTAASTDIGAVGTASSSSDDFYAKAQALGLRLSREDIERTRAGIAAFLKAERVPSTTSLASAKPGSSSSVLTTSSADKASAREAQRRKLDHSPTPANNASSVLGASASLKPGSTYLARSAGAGGPSWMPSFFSAVVAPTAECSAAPKIRVSLDEVGSAEEKRRLKLKKEKLRQRRVMLAQHHGQDPETPCSSLAAQSTPGSRDSRHIFQTPPSIGAQQARKLKHGSSGSRRRRIGLGLDLEDSDGNASPLPSTPPEVTCVTFGSRKPRGRTVSFDTSSPDSGHPMRHCASLDDLSRRAWVSPRGKLHLLSSAVVDQDAVFPSPDVEVEVDDAAAFGFEGDGGVPADGWGAKRRRESSSATGCADGLETVMGKLGILDHVMAQQGSPRRLYKEEKQREKAAKERRRNAELQEAEEAARQIAMLAKEAEVREAEAAHATEVANAIKAANPDFAGPTSVATPNTTRRKRLQSDAQGLAATPRDSSGRPALVGASAAAAMTPRNGHARMSTREHYDFMLHGISPGQLAFDSLESICNISNTPGPISFTASWDAEPLSAVRAAAVQRSVLASATPFQSSLFNDEAARPELIGVSPSVAGLGQIRGGSSVNNGLLASHAKMLRSTSDGLVVSPLARRLQPSIQSRISDLDFDEDILHAEEHGEGLSGMAGPASSAFNPKRGLLFGASPSSSKSRAAGMEATLTASPGVKGFNVLNASPLRGSGNSLGSRLAFASPRTVLLRAHSGSSLEATALRKTPGPNSPFGGRRAINQHATADNAFDTISPADVFGSSLQPADFGKQQQQQQQQQPLPEPVKVVRGDLRTDVFSDDEPVEAEYTSDVELSARKKHIVGRRARSHSPESPMKQVETVSILQGGVAYPAVQLSYGMPTEEAMAQAGGAVAAKGATAPAVKDEAAEKKPGVKVKAKSATKAAGKSTKTSSAHSAGPTSNPPSPTAVARSYAAGSAQSLHFDRMAMQPPSVKSSDETAWDQPDGSRLVKLVSEELQAALDAGTLEQEPPARYYLLPPGFGQLKTKPSAVSYAGLIGQAIKASSDMRLSLAEVYSWISTTYPFFEKGDRGWQNSIRHNLSLNKSFMKIEREANMPGKGGWWGIQPGHEDRFQNGQYNASGQTKGESSKSKKHANASNPTTPALVANKPLPGVEEQPAKKKAAVTKRKRTALLSAAAQRDSAASSDDEGDSSDGGDLPLSMVNARPKKRTKTLGADKGVKQATRLPLAEMQLQPESAAPLALESLTPVRPHGSMYASSVAGSQHSRGAPMLTDSASSPPSSPFGLMPPPTVQMTADHSALKRKLAASAHGDGPYGGMSYNSSGYSPSPFGIHASPLSAAASGRANPYRSMRGSALGGAFSFSAPAPSDGGSPLRRIDKDYTNTNMLSTSPKRLWSISSPTSSMRGSAKPAHANVSVMDEGSSAPPNRSPTNTSGARMAALAHSPVRGSPLRHASSTFDGSPGRSMASSTSLQAHLGMGGASSGQSLGMGFGLGMGNTPGRKSNHSRFGSGLSPMRRSLMSSSAQPMQQQSQQSQSGYAAPQHQHLPQQHDRAQPGWYMDDPFAVQGGSFAAHQAQSMSGAFSDVGHGNASDGGPTASPLRMMWNTIQAAGGVQAFASSYHDGTHPA